MISLIYTIGTGLNEIASLDQVPSEELNAGGSYFRGRPSFLHAFGWYRHIHVTDTPGDPYWHWERTNKNELPKKLKAWALIMGIEL